MRSHEFFAVDNEGNAYYFRLKSNEIQWKPKKMNVNNVIKIQGWTSFDECECIVLKECGKVFIYDFDKDNIISEIIVSHRITDIFKDLSETEKYVLELGRSGLKKTNYINFYDYYSSMKNITYKQFT